MVPVMALIYIVASVIVILFNITALPGALAAIVKGAFNPASVAGGLAAAIYGIEGIPEVWIDGLLKKEGLLAVCEQFANYAIIKNSEIEL